MAGTFQFYTDASESFVGSRDLDLIRAINPRVQTLEDRMIEHREQLKSASS
jgi:hypothetical protein